MFTLIKKWCKTGNCTCFFEGTWTDCCKKHDKRYENKRLSKFQADILLYRCVKQKGKPIIAGLMFIGVTLGGYQNYKRANNK